MTWQPIETAPRDHMIEILATDYDSIEIIHWNSSPLILLGWFTRDSDFYFPSLWQPLPETPELPPSLPEAAP